MKRPLSSDPAASPAPSTEARPAASAERAVWPTTRRRFLSMVLAAGGLAATAAVARRGAAAPAGGSRPRWIGHC